MTGGAVPVAHDHRPDVAATGAPPGDEGRHGDRTEHERQRAVPELDRGVVVDLAVRHVGVLAAPRPRRAPEAGPGEAHRATRHHDPDVRDQVRPPCAVWNAGATPEGYAEPADVPNVATSSLRLLTPIFAKTDLR